MEFEEVNIVEQPDPEKVRKLPWFIDVFCYPVSIPGLTILGIYVFTPVILSLTISALSAVLGPLSVLLMPLGLVFFIINIIVSAYMFWYFGMCIHESAVGKVRAPETLSGGIDEDIMEMALQLLRIVCCVFVCVGPGLTYYSITNRLDWICWLLLGCGVFFLPMALLAMVMFGSFSGLNPIIIVPSIFSTFLGYCLAVLALCVPVAIAVGILVCLPKGSGTVVVFIMRGMFAYFALVAAHILGRFYYRNAGRLYWEV